MNQYVKLSLDKQGIPVCEKDIQHIHALLNIIQEASIPLQHFHELNLLPPILVIDQRVMGLE